MLDHLGVNVPDLPRAKDYYDAIMPVLGFEPFFITEKEFSYKPAGGKPGTTIFFYIAREESDYSRWQDGLQHLAFRARSRAEVDAAHEKAIELGSEIIRTPRLFPRFHENYYATFWYDPHRFMLEMVCNRPPE